MSKIYDIFSFNNELELLDIRLNILTKYVDHFVIVESTKTFSGKEKPLNYNVNKELFKSFHNKIIHHIIDDSPSDYIDSTCDQECLNLALNSSNVTRENICWLIEFYQKEQIKKALFNLDDDDICIVSDLDEIWNYQLSLDIDNNSIYKPKLNLCYIDYLNVRTNEDWTFFTGPIITRYKNIKNECLNHLRTLGKMRDKYIYIENGGWHFNALGGIEKKIKDFQHPVYDIPYMESRRNGSRIDESDLPDYILNNKEKYKHLMKYEFC